MAPAPAMERPSAEQPNLALRQAIELERRFPELRHLGLPLSEKTADALLDFYNSYLPLLHPGARGAHLRTLLQRLHNRCPAVAAAATRAIARSDLADGMPDRAQVLDGDSTARDELRRETAEFEAQYGAALISQPWPDASRGAALLYYLESHPELVSGKDVLHCAPEAEARDWLAGMARTYRTLDATPGNVDFVRDITDTGLRDASFDLVICHRVLEHVLDDIGAMRELYRVLRRDGMLNLSVPQAAHRAQTAEWCVPDESHHCHVRQYGQDLLDRLAGAGFSVEIEPWLLRQPRAELLGRAAFPMRMVNARKL